MFFMYLVLMLLMFLSIAFFTIMERKLLGSFHIRIGPNKMGMMGLFQPFSDALKLFSKNMNFFEKMNWMYWNMSSVLMMLFLLLFFKFLLIKMELNNMKFNLMMLMMFFGIAIFPLFWGSFYSFSKFSIIGSKRAISQMLSYEMGIMMFFFFMLTNLISLNLELIMLKNTKILFNIIMMMIMFIMILSESSRIPFDFIEGESELISGFNTEYSSSYFSLLFIYEYGMMLFFSILISMMMLNFIFCSIMLYYFIFIRASFPRIRYDQMMYFLWKLIYPILIMLFSIFYLY